MADLSTNELLFTSAGLLFTSAGLLQESTILSPPQNPDVFSWRSEAADSRHLGASAQSQPGNQPPHRGFNSQLLSQQLCPGNTTHMQEQQDDALVWELLSFPGLEENAAALSFQMQNRFLEPTPQESECFCNSTSSPTFWPSYLAYWKSFQVTLPTGSSFSPAFPSAPSATDTQQQQPAFEQQQQAKKHLTNPLEPEKPAKLNANSGTYTCTYHGCTLRFDTRKQFKVHKKQRHRKSASIDGGLRDSQAGPHKCKQKLCNTIFSRSYDLTRHEETVHSACKKEIKCEFCILTMSRNDSLTRHMRSKHPKEHIDRNQLKRKRRKISSWLIGKPISLL